MSRIEFEYERRKDKPEIGRRWAVVRAPYNEFLSQYVYALDAKYREDKENRSANEAMDNLKLRVSLLKDAVMKRREGDKAKFCSKVCVGSETFTRGVEDAFAGSGGVVSVRQFDRFSKQQIERIVVIVVLRLVYYIMYKCIISLVFLLRSSFRQGRRFSILGRFQRDRVCFSEDDDLGANHAVF